jgi:predicted DNA-binding transcriptional regulator AlpA
MRSIPAASRGAPWGLSVFSARSARAATAPPTADPQHLGEAVAGIAEGLALRILGSPAIRDGVFERIRAIIREEIVRAPFADRLLEASEAAERLGMSEAALRKAAARGTVPCRRIGRRLRFRLSELLAGDRGSAPGE